MEASCGLILTSCKHTTRGQACLSSISLKGPDVSECSSSCVGRALEADGDGVKYDVIFGVSDFRNWDTPFTFQEIISNRSMTSKPVSLLENASSDVWCRLSGGRLMDGRGGSLDGESDLVILRDRRRLPIRMDE